ncbi:MAG: hypothetical protein HC906_12525 [Bacteroidales bacterium]|nr:hypothetical protein [Bacteroidales bacterium]
MVYKNKKQTGRNVHDPQGYIFHQAGFYDKIQNGIKGKQMAPNNFQYGSLSRYTPYNSKKFQKELW